MSGVAVWLTAEPFHDDASPKFSEHTLPGEFGSVLVCQRERMETNCAA